MPFVTTVDALPDGLRLDAGSLVRLLSPGATAHTALGFLHGVAPLDYVSVVEYGDGPPRQLAGHALSGAPQTTTQRCFETYRSRFYRHDQATGIAQDLRRAEPDDPRTTVLCYDAEDLPDAGWRKDIFVSEGLSGRLSFLFGSERGLAVAVNVYRKVHRGRFGRAEIERMVDVAPLIRLAFRSRRATTTPGGLEAALDARAPRLSSREREVALLIAQGMAGDSIAANLGVAPSTVVTLRKRLYLKLRVHSRLELCRLLD